MTGSAPETLPLQNPFGAPLYWRKRLSSTMDEARRLAAQGAPQGTVIAAGSQEAGRGRMGRPWSAAEGESLLFTIILRCPSPPPALTLRAGLALALAVEDFAPPLKGQTRIKWPNDLMIRSRKAAGILTEGDGAAILIGMGVNLAQRDFPQPLTDRAISIAQALKEDPAPGERFILLEKILRRLYGELSLPPQAASPWREQLEARLFRRGEAVRFIPGSADSGRVVEGRLEGIGEGGELLIKTPEGSVEPFITGELRFL